MSNHLGLDFNLVESLAVVYSHHGSGHFRHDNHVAQMGLDNIGFLIDGALFLLLTQLLDQSHGLALQASAELSADSAGQEFHQLLIVHVQELVEVHSAVSELAEGTLLLELGGLQIKKLEIFKITNKTQNT